MRAARDPIAHYYAAITRRARACVFGGINFGDLLKNSPIRQIKIPAKVSGCTVCSSEMPPETNAQTHSSSSLVS